MTPDPTPSKAAELPDWARAIKCDRIDRTSDDSWLLQWEQGPCTLIDFYDNGEVVVIGADPCPEHPDREAVCEVTVADREWIEAFAKDGWNQERFKP